jgi:NAD(P)-dependent dehydrogenase (short-subunit alcohol dehydrogenase family)
MTIADRAVLVTGANRGIGQALVAEALRSGARRAGTRQPLAHPDGRVTPLALDITNAGLALYEDLSDPAALERHLAVNLFGTYGVTQAFLPLLTGSRGAIVNLLSIAAFAPIPVMPAYSISKAAAFNLTQIAARAVGRTGRAGPRRPGRPRGHRDGPRPRYTEDRSGVGRAGHRSTGWSGGRRRSSPTPCPRPWRRAGAAARPRRSSARMRRS